jgi:hypothetical protein
MGDSNDLSTRVVNSAGATILNARSIHDLKGSMTLPTEKQPPSITPEKALMLIYSDPKIGKTSLAAGMDPDHTLVLATEPGTGGLEAFVHPVREWPEFLGAVDELAKGKHSFKRVSVDSADALYAMCVEYAMAELNRREGKTGRGVLSHPHDWPYGKGWDAVAIEWRRIARLCSIGMGVTFTSHAKSEEIERPVGTVTRYSPSLSGSALRVLNRFVEFVFYLEVQNIRGHDVRVLRSAKSPMHVAGGRFQRPMPDPLVIEADPPMAAGRILWKAMAEATRVEKPKREAVPA